MLAHSFTRDNRLYNLYASNLPIDARPGTAQSQVTGYGHHQNSSAPSSFLDNLVAASARLLSIRYGFDSNDPALSAVQLPFTCQSNSFLRRPVSRSTSYHLGRRPVL